MTAHDLSLDSVKKAAKSRDIVYRVSDFLSKEKRLELKVAQEQKSTRKRRKFDEIDAFSAEILARFGFRAWQAWQAGQIKNDKMAKMVLAERARAKRELLGLESLILAVNAGANNPTKNGRAPKGLRNAIKILKSEQKQAKGVL